ncbi:hypothetical protein EN866_34880 [Mesorhizobium sp. M2D.F.Ca.ET.223.01.1.1]|uniref:hypothetical protein n=1 Tax=Mesorhizobium sp. M2D.F.Ca.ET.223.01.1.1 TaxID=2563940 RepID=UPI001091CF70|nr:hypothetical protein [Mesorhizobium sp. M2D.F.Ca.ET.223.01.1.1]TGR82318.1 hypothetical protein EN866_34880 [Mesorhizobium sp. M2D.F.Ca.ET.223.01.1.1]TGT64420.1 hypothetical protein EN802_32825 [bacterium M00.F.Ca.ET.159.01.1.1]TGT79249.1 hypothetical protein EN800_32170 [bacterium M00.F.Ca.ET.157.01.1.1]
MSAFKESERLRQVFSKAAGGSFSIVYRAMCECARRAESALLKEEDVLAEIAAIRQDRNVT